MLNCGWGRSLMSPAGGGRGWIVGGVVGAVSCPPLAGAGGGKGFRMNIKVYQRGDVILDTYLVENIRAGAMGNVYVAEHKKWKIKVAIKAPNEKILST